MAVIPSVFAPVNNGDFTVTPFEVNKQYFISSSRYEEYGYRVYEGVYDKSHVEISSSQALYQPRNSEGSYKSVIWNNLYNYYYRYKDHIYENSNIKLNYKFLNLSCSLLTVPVMDFGLKIKEGTLRLNNSDIALQDDKYGHLVDPTILTSSFIKSSNLCLYLGFEDFFGVGKTIYSEISREVDYKSNVFIPKSKAKVLNLLVQNGVSVDGNFSGLGAGFLGNSYIKFENEDKLNYGVNDDFTISFWIKSPLSQSNVGYIDNTIISKKDVIDVIHKGFMPKLLDSGVTVNSLYMSESLDYKPTDVYPYNFSIYNQSATSSLSGKIEFKRSNGFDTLTLLSTSSFSNLDYKHVCVTKTGSLVSLYVDGNLESSGSDVTGNTINSYDLLVGASNFNYVKSFSGSLDEIRFYNKGASQTNIDSLKDNSQGALYQKNIVGNIFYRTGNIVITSPLRKYNNFFKENNWELYYKNSNILYEYQILCRVKKGSFNSTLNPTALKNNSDIFLDYLTGSANVFVTSVGLYNQYNDLVAVGKFSSPLRIRDDVDINFLIRWDY